MSTQDFDAAVNAYREALQSMLKGDSTPVLNLYSRRDDVTLANPLGPPHVGRANLEKASAAVAATFAVGLDVGAAGTAVTVGAGIAVDAFLSSPPQADSNTASAAVTRLVVRRR